MNDPIDRQAALDALAAIDMEIEDGDGFNYPKWLDYFSDLPSAEKRGKWERHWSRPGVYADLYWHCTACGGKTDMQFAYIYFKYCPYCGATMERGADE